MGEKGTGWLSLALVVVVCSCGRAQADAAACRKRLAAVAVVAVVGHACADMGMEPQAIADHPQSCTGTAMTSVAGRQH